MKGSKFVAVMAVCVMVIGVVRPVSAGWSGNKEVKKQAEKFGEVGKTVSAAYQVYDTSSKLYNARNNNERKDILIDTAKDVGKDIVKAPIKAVADTAITTGATSTAVYLAGAAGMTA